MDVKSGYEHVLVITLHTQFRKNANIIEQVKDTLGPWCGDVEVVSLNRDWNEKE